jgi:hypothetical protein
MKRTTSILATIVLGAVLAAGSATVCMARGSGGHGGGGGGDHAASGHGFADGGHGFRTGRRGDDDFYSDPYFCEPYPAKGSTYLGTDGILPYCP